MVHLSNLGVERVRVAVSDSKQAKNKKRECLLAHLSNLGVERVRVVVSDSKQAKNKQDCLLAHLSNLGVERVRVVVSDSKQAKNKVKYYRTFPSHLWPAHNMLSISY